MTRRAFIFGAMAAFAAAGLPGETALQSVADPRPILQDLHRKMASVDSVYLEFTQERRLKLFTEPLRSEGVMLIAKPDKIRWETTAPYQSILLSGDKSVAQFEKRDGKWEKLNLGFPDLLRRVMQQMAMMNQGKLEALTTDYTVSVATGGVAVITMVPKDRNAREAMSSLELIMPLDLSTTREVVMNEPNGDLTRITFSHERRNVAFPAVTFNQSKPLDIAAVKAAAQNAP
jgi:outer membrane lipoprotein-sorting protein